MRNKAILGFLAIILMWCGFPVLTSFAAADSSQRIIEPFMAGPFGSTKAEVMQAEGFQENEHNFLIYNKTFMDMSVNVDYFFSYDRIKSSFDKNDDDSLRTVSVSFTQTNLSFQDVQAMSAEITALVKAQLHEPQTISKLYERQPVQPEPDGRVQVIKEYLKDGDIIVALGFWWYEAEGVCAAKLTFCDLRIGDKDAQDLEYVFKPEHSAERFLSQTLEPVFKYDLNTSPDEFKQMNGAPAEELKSWTNTTFMYDQPVWGVPAKTETFFERSYSYIGFKYFNAFHVSLNLTCTSVEAAEAAVLKITELLAAEISADKGIGYGLPHGYKYLRGGSWMGFSMLAAVNSHAHISSTWSESDENLNIRIMFMKKALSDEDYENYTSYAGPPHRRIFYDVNGD